MTRWEAETLLYCYEVVETAESDRLSPEELESGTTIGNEAGSTGAIDDPKNDA